MAIEHNTPEELEKIARYQHVIHDATTSIWAHLGKRAEAIPEAIQELTEEQLEVILDIESVEQEWILDLKIRQDISVVQWVEDEED